jgi:DNA helicase-2/ATP-dependent DNA helicase PcrA
VRAVSVENHPAFEEERGRLGRSLQTIDSQLRRLLATREIQVEEEEEDALHAIRAAQEAMETMREEQVERLKVAAREPYFGRIDFQEKGLETPQELYIGKAGVQEEGTNRPLVIDWRAPVASLFYTSAGGGDDTAAYEAPGGLVEGLLWLKRNLAVKGRKLQHIADARVKGAPEEAAEGDTFLLYRLQESRDAKLRDIVSTIQAEQNAIIRAERDRPLIIQGVAGSGKTTVALHRLAYLLYTYRESMSADRMVIFAPSRMFLDYIADVLPELGVGGIKQTTFQDWAVEQLDDQLELLSSAERLEELFAPGRDPGEEGAPGRFKGSLFFKELLDRALNAYEANFVPEMDLELWRGARVSHREVHSWFHEQYKLYPLNTRKDRIIARLRTWARAAVDPYRGTLREAERKKAMMTAVRQYVAAWPKHTALSLYKEVLGLGSPRGKRAIDFGGLEIPDAVRAEAKALFQAKQVSTEDLAPLVYLQERLEGLKEDRQLDHVVIDEAQDFSPLQVDLLRRLTEADSFTILGDLSQGIHTYAGIADWDEFVEVFPPGRVEYHALRQSYRSTHEIVTFAAGVLRRAGVPEDALPLPVFRAGEPVRLYQAEAAGRNAAVVAEVRRMQENHASVAVVGRTEAEVTLLHAALQAEGLEAERITAEQQRYLGGLSVIPSYLTKGLEFDAVIVADAGAHNYGMTPRDARLLYVVLTRALHELAVLYTEEASPLLA